MFRSEKLDEILLSPNSSFSLLCSPDYNSHFPTLVFSCCQKVTLAFSSVSGLPFPLIRGQLSRAFPRALTVLPPKRIGSLPQGLALTPSFFSWELLRKFSPLSSPAQELLQLERRMSSRKDIWSGDTIHPLLPLLQGHFTSNSAFVSTSIASSGGINLKYSTAIQVLWHVTCRKKLVGVVHGIVIPIYLIMKAAERSCKGDL